MLALNLYSTDECHLCELAEALVLQVLPVGSYALEKVDIAYSEDLVARYGLRIPVLAVADGTAELNWPFTAEQLSVWAAEQLQE